MSYSRWATRERSPWYAWGGSGPYKDAEGNYSPPPADGPLVLAIWHNGEDEAVHITAAEAEAMMRGEAKIQDRFPTALTPRELQLASAILVEYLADVAEEAGERDG